jgi:hypothetical protein
MAVTLRERVGENTDGANWKSATNVSSASRGNIGRYLAYAGAALLAGALAYGAVTVNDSFNGCDFDGKAFLEDFNVHSN